MAQEEPRGPDAGSARGLDEGLCQHAARFGPRQARDPHPAGESQYQHHQWQARLPQRDEGQEQGDAREHKRGVGGGHQRPVDDTTGQGGDEPYRSTDRQRYGHRQESDREGNPRPVDQPSQQVSTQLVGPEPMGDVIRPFYERSEEAGVEHVVLSQGVQRREEGGERRDRRQRQQDRDPACRPTVPQQRARAVHGGGSLSRGSATAYSASARVFPATTSAPKMAVVAMTTG